MSYAAIVGDMKPHLLVKALVEKAGGEMSVARAMGAPTFQATLWKFTHGKVPDPSRKTAQRISDHFGFPAEVIYSEALAAEWADRLLLADKPAKRPAEPPQDAAWPLDPFISKERWERLSDAQRAAFAWEANKLLAQFEGADLARAPYGKRQVRGRA